MRTVERSALRPHPAPDADRLRRGRGERLRGAMADAGIDALILLGQANVAYATGVTSPLGYAGRTSVDRPVAVVLLDDPVPHLCTPFLADAAEELGLDDDHLHGPTYLDVAEGVEAFALLLATLVPRTAAVAVDEVTGAMAFLDADILDAGPLLRAVRRTKTEDEVEAIRGAVAVADAALAAAATDLGPGVTEAELTDRCLEAMAALGVPLPGMQARVRITSLRDGGTGSTRDVVRAGDLVAFHAGVVVQGYAAERARTLPVATRPSDEGVVHGLYRRYDELWARLLDACRPGVPASALLDAYRAAGEPLPVMPIARGLGLGHDDPVIVRDLPETAEIERLDPGLVLVITGCAFDDAVGMVLGREAVRITADGPEVLSARPSWNHERVGARR